MMRLVALILSIACVAVLVGCGSSGPKLYDWTSAGSGLKYRDIIVGTGVAPDHDDLVVVHYAGWLTNGKYIESSDGGDPIEVYLGLNHVIRGWEEGIKGMRQGGRRRLEIPPDMAYGAGGNPQMGIPANATLVYEIELVEVKKLNWVTTASGLKYVDLKEGYGPSPETGQRCSVHYTGWLLDGTMFDSSYNTGSPFEFAIGTGQVIKGWDEGVATMVIGTKRRLIIPPDLGYGASGSGKIPPNATLLFDVELLDIDPGDL